MDMFTYLLTIYRLTFHCVDVGAMAVLMEGNRLPLRSSEFHDYAI